MEDWSSFSEIGRDFGGQQLTFEQYLIAENAYADAANSFFAEANLDFVTVVHCDMLPEIGIAARLKGIALTPAILKTGSVISRGDLADIVRLNLREVIWCKLAAKNQFYLDFGWDFYMYVGSASPSVSAIQMAESHGLFVESMQSPYS